MHSLLLVVLLASSDVETLRGQLHTYSSGEALAGVPFTASGLASVGAGLLLTNDPTARGAAWPLFGFATLETAFGVYLATRNPSRLAELDAQLTATRAPSSPRNARA